jgi:hypothetical protein
MNNQAHLRLLLDSYQRLLGKPLAESPQAILDAPFVVVSHGTETDPIFNFGNPTALALFELSYADFTQLPSRKSAEPLERSERQRLLDRVTRYGFIDDYEGIRISSTGRRFTVKNAVVWNVIDAEGIHRGQAATFSQWTFLP